MNRWTQLSIDYANQKTYLDDLFRIYPTIPEGIRNINQNIWNAVENAFSQKDNINLIDELLKLDLFPIKDSYVAYLRRDKTAIARNPQTVNRLCGRIYELGLDEIYKRCAEPKETNRQIGPMFKEWIRKQSLGIAPVDINTFVSSECNAILDASDNQMMEFAKEKLGYRNNKD